MAEGVKDRYQHFVDDHNAGTDRATLCGRYGVKPDEFERFLGFLKRKGYRLAVAAGGGFTGAHEIDFEIHGDDLQFVEVELDPGETAIADAGAMMYMDED
ncbi:MAG TPA: AIM24 family protein, partial [Vicinamibacteria bacterium]|nr:AIM24 family protein [Vicinamibacteria bacterium]